MRVPGLIVRCLLEPHLDGPARGLSAGGAGRGVVPGVASAVLGGWVHLKGD